MRLFVALALPDEIMDLLALIQSGVPGARWSSRDQMHLTLRFIGQVDGRVAGAIDDGLSTVSTPPFALALKDVGQFGGKNPSALCAGIAPSENLIRLQRKIENALQRVGIPAETRKYTPHITLARLKGAPRGRVIDYLANHGLFSSPQFDVGAFILYSSHLTPNGSLYRAEKAYQLK